MQCKKELKIKQRNRGLSQKGKKIREGGKGKIFNRLWLFKDA